NRAQVRRARVRGAHAEPVLAGGRRRPRRPGRGGPRQGRRPRRPARRGRRRRGRPPQRARPRQREDRRDRLLLGRAAGVPRRLLPGPRRRRRLLRRVRGPRAAAGRAARGRADRLQGAGPVVPAARAVRGGGPVPVAGGGRRARRGADPARQGARVPRLPRRRARVLRRRAARVPPGGRQGRLGEDLRLLRPPPERLRGGSMCTYQTFKVELDGAAKGASGWFTLAEGAVYVDHPYHASHEHTVNIDFTDPAGGPSSRVAVELTEESALALVEAI